MVLVVLGCWLGVMVEVLLLGDLFEMVVLLFVFVVGWGVDVLEVLKVLV